MTKQVLVVEDHLDKGESDVAFAAAERCAAEVSVITAGDHPALDDGPTRVVVAALAPGERRIPKAILSLLRDLGQPASLLLLAREPVVKRTTFLESGWLALVGLPHSLTHVASRMRMLLAAPGKPDTAFDGPAEIRGERHWVGTFCNEAGRARSPVGFGGAREITFVIPGATGAPATVDLMRVPGKVLGRMSRELQSTVVRVDLARGVWVLSSPEKDPNLALASPHRAPLVAPIKFHPERDRDVPGTLRAATGDVLVALSTAVADLEADPAWRASIEGGGGAVLDLLESRFGKQSSPFAAVVMELL